MNLGYTKASALFEPDGHIHKVNDQFEDILDSFIRNDLGLRPASTRTYRGERNSARRTLKPMVSIIHPPGDDALNIGAYRVCGGVTESHKAAGYETRESWVCRRVCDISRRMISNTTRSAVSHEAAHESANQRHLREVLGAVSSPDSAICLYFIDIDGENTQLTFMGTTFPLDVSGKMCLVALAMRLREPLSKEPGSEAHEAARILGALKSTFMPSELLHGFAKAHLREYITLDYPKKFVWHAQMFRVKNTFLEFKSPPDLEDMTVPMGPSLRDKESRERCAKMKILWTSSMPEPIMLDIKQIRDETNRKMKPLKRIPFDDLDLNMTVQTSHKSSFEQNLSVREDEDGLYDGRLDGLWDGGLYDDISPQSHDGTMLAGGHDVQCQRGNKGWEEEHDFGYPDWARESTHSDVMSDLQQEESSARSHLEGCSQPSSLLTAGSKRLDLVMRDHLLENTQENEQGRRIRENMKISFGVSLPTSNSFVCSRICGGNDWVYESTGLNRQQLVGRYAGDIARFGATSEHDEMRKAIMDIDPTSEAMIATHLLVPGTRLVGYAVPLNIDGKICIVSCVIRMKDQAAPEYWRRWNRAELECALKVVDAFKHKVSMSEDIERYVQANVREYFLVDYPRKFMWHDSLFTVKNTFLYVKSSYDTRESASEDADAECVNHETIHDYINPIKLVYDANERNLKFFESVLRDEASVGERDSIYAPVDSPWGSTIAHARAMPTPLPIASRRSTHSSKIAPRGRVFPSRVPSSFSNEICSEAWSPTTKKWEKKREVSSKSKRYGALEVTSREMKSEDSENGRELLEESHTGDFPSFSDARFFNSFGPWAEDHESPHFVPSYVPSPTFLTCQEHRSSASSTISPSNNELLSSSSTPQSVSTAHAPAPSKQECQLRVGDYVELHSFPRATWMCGLKARVKHVVGLDQKRKNRAGRVSIEYVDPEFRKNPLYYNTVPLTNVRLIAKKEETE